MIDLVIEFPTIVVERASLFLSFIHNTTVSNTIVGSINYWPTTDISWAHAQWLWKKTGWRQEEVVRDRTKSSCNCKPVQHWAHDAASDIYHHLHFLIQLCPWELEVSQPTSWRFDSVHCDSIKRLQQRIIFLDNFLEGSRITATFRSTEASLLHFSLLVCPDWKL